MIQHQCLKCSAKYQDNDEDDYLCSPCLADRKAIAAKIDAERASLPRTQPKSEFQLYEEAPKFKGFMIVKG